MAVVKSFKAIRPTIDLVSKVASLPYDVMNSQEAKEMVKDNPYSFLHVDKAEIDLDDITITDKVYKKAKENLQKMISEKTYIQDEKSCLYIYRLTMNGREQTGLVACTSINEYINGVIKKHELTREDKEMDRINHVDACNANTGPIFMTYRYEKEIDEIIKNYAKENKLEYDFTSEDNIRHTVWVINDESLITKISELFKKVPNLYIADGHHRNASAVKVGLKRREANKDLNAEFNYYLSVIFPDNELLIMDYNRLVRDLNGLSKEEFLQKLSEKFEIAEVETAYSPSKRHTFGMYLDKKWYCLTAKNEIINESDEILSLDVSILQSEVLTPILNIGDIRTDKRIDFVGGLRGLQELEKRVDSGEMKIAFSMFPTSMSELMRVADADKIMPPKSTWFEPKLRSGIFIHSLE